MTAAGLFVVTLMAVASGISFVLTGVDKRHAGLGLRRVPEARFFQLAALGGWPGGLLGQRTFRHKTQKASFRAALWLAASLHVALAGGLLLLADYLGR